MKFSVFFKTLTAFFIIAVVFIFVFFKYMKSVEIAIAVNSEKVISDGFLVSIEKNLAHLPKSNWSTFLKKKSTALYYQKINKTKLLENQKKQLRNGDVVVLTSPDYQFLNLVIDEKIAFKKIGDTDYVVAYNYSNMQRIILSYMKPILNEITSYLLSSPKHSWHMAKKRLEKTYGYPIQVYQTGSSKIPPKVINSLSGNELVFETNPNSTQISIIYYPFNDYVLKIGPIKYLSITTRISDIISYFVMAFFIASFLLILFLSYLFVKNMKKIYQITQEFSSGNFDFHQKIPKTSVLFGLYSNIMSMGKKIKELIESHKQLCQFVAHEVRTPLTTMQMATDSIKARQENDIFIGEQASNIEDDIKDMNQMVSSFLIYSKMHSRELKINKSKVDIIPWLKNILEPFQTSQFKIKLNTNKINSIITSIDSSLFKHAITNVITNALKFAEHHILLTVSLSNSHIHIHVDDDGPGLGENTKDIFNQYIAFNGFHENNKHIGLGLAIAKKVVEMHSSSIKATNSPILSGARFTISIQKFDLT